MIKKEWQAHIYIMIVNARICFDISAKMSTRAVSNL